MIAPEPKPASSSHHDADAWFTPGRFALLLGTLLILTFPGVLFGQETFFFRDFGIFGYPLAQYHRDCFWHGTMPLWNPLNWCGLPFLAQWNTLTLYPGSLLYLLFPLSWSLGFFNLAHLFFAGLGMYFLARRWTANNLAAAVGGILFAFNGLTWHSLMWPNDIAGLAWMPWVVLAVERAWTQGGRAIIWAILAGALQMLTGAPEIILLTWIFTGLLWLTQFAAEKNSRLPMTGRATVTVMLVAGIAAAQLFPFLDLLAHSHRDPTFGGADWPMPLTGLANFLAPLFRCFQASQGVFMQHDQFWIASYYLGAGTIVLAAAAAWRPQDRRIWLLLIMTIGSVWMALGLPGHLYAVMKRLLPMLGFMRYPIKFVVLAVFSIPLLAASAVSRQRLNPSPQFRKIIIGLAAVFLVILAAIAWVDWQHPEPSENWTVSWHNLLLRAVFIVAVPVLLLGLTKARSFKPQLYLGLGLLLLLWCDVYTLGPTLSPTLKRSVYEPGLIRTQLKIPPPQIGEPRFMSATASMEQLHFRSIIDPANDYLCRRLALFDNCNLLDQFPKIDGFYSLYLRETVPVIELLYTADEQNIDLKGLKDFLGIAHINPPGTNQERALEWTTRDTALPLITVGQNPIFASDTNTVAALAQPGFNPVDTVYLPTNAATAITARRTDAKIISQKLEAQNLSVTVASSAPALVVVAQAFYHPWHAYVDGQPAQLWRANYAFQAVQMPAGQHELRLAYEDSAFKWGAVISLGSLLLTVAGWFYFKRN